MKEAITEAYSLALKLASILEEIKESSIGFDDLENYKELYDKSDSLQSDLYTKLQELKKN